MKKASCIISGTLIILAVAGWTLPLGKATGLNTPEEPSAPGQGAKQDDRKADRAAIQKATDAFIRAFETGDAKGVAGHWTNEGEYIADDGTTVRGRAELEKVYIGFFKKHPKAE